MINPMPDTRSPLFWKKYIKFGKNKLMSRTSLPKIAPLKVEIMGAIHMAKLIKR